MWSLRMGSLSRPRPSGRRVAAWAALALGWLLPSTGCQVEYAGMTLPSGKYMHDDVQYFAPGPDFPWANTQAATQRARMQAMGIEVPPAGSTGPMAAPVPPGALDPTQNRGGRPTDTNVSPLDNEGPAPAPPAAMPPAAPPVGAPAVPAPPPAPAGAPGVPEPPPAGGAAVPAPPGF